MQDQRPRSRRPRGGSFRRLLRLPLILAVASLALSACATRPSGGPADDSQVSGGQMITGDEITRSGARDAYEALIRARTHLMIEDVRGNNEAGIYHRGRDSLVSDGRILVIVDGTPTTDPIRALRDVPAHHILYMKVLSAREATPRYGMLAGNGAVYIRTVAGGA